MRTARQGRGRLESAGARGVLTCGVALAGALLAAHAWAPQPGEAAVGPPRVSANTPATANDLSAPRGQNSAQLAEDPTDARFVALAHRLDAPDFGCALQLSGDGGRGWIPADPVPELPPRAEKCYAPEIAFDRNGRLYYLFLGLRGRGNNPVGAFLTYSDDRGRSFSEPRRVLGERNYQVRLALDRSMGDSGRIHVVWLRTPGDSPTGGLPAPPNPIMSMYSDDGGESFSRPVQVNDAERELSVAPALALGPDHAVHVLYYDLQDDRRDYQGLEGPAWEGRWSLVAATSSDGGRRFGRGVVVDERLVPPERVMLIYTMPPPSLVVGRSGLFAAWHDARNGDWDVFLSRSTDRGSSWGKPQRLNDDRRGNGRHQYQPRLDLAPDGRLDAIFYDRRQDPKNLRNHVFHTYSRDGGRSFASNVRVTSAASDTRTGQRYAVRSAEGKYEFGGRVGLLSRRRSALAAWTDARNTAFSAGQDIFTSELTLPRAVAAVAPGAGGARDAAARPGPAAAFAILTLFGLLLPAVAAASARRGRFPAEDPRAA